MKKESTILSIVIAFLIALVVGRYSAVIAPPHSASKGAEGAKVDKPAVPLAVAVGQPTGGVADPVPGTMPSKGKVGALVTVIEISDFQCPFCGRATPTIHKLEQNYPDDVRVVWANNPLPFHDNAKPAAIAAMAAHRQGKFWAMHDKLFANQRQLSTENYKKWAKELGLDLGRFESDLQDPTLVRRIQADQAAANALGSRGTPGFFINGKLLSGALPYPAFKSAVDAALAVAKKQRAAGKSGTELMAAAWAETGGETGTKVFKWLVKGEKPAAAPAPTAQRKAVGPAKAPPESMEVWKIPVDPKRDYIRGNSAEALVTIVEFSDFQCPFCGRATTTVDALLKEYGDKVRLVFKHHPLPFHQNAGPAHEASIAAGQQGKFWEFHDKCFANQGALTEDNFLAWAGELGLNIKKFNSFRKTKEAENRIREDMALASTVKVRGTPNFFINGRRLVGAQPAGVFKAVIDEEIKQAREASAKGQGHYDKIIADGKVFSELDAKVNRWDLSKLPFKGPADAKIVVTEFSDFQCPYCSRVPGPLMEAVGKYKARVKVVFAYYPLSFHRNAKPAAIMAQEAYEQGGSELFWKVHDDLFASQRELSDDKIKEIATKHGVKWENVEKHRARHEKTIAASMAAGNAAGVRGTPSLYINGRKYEPAGGFSAAAFSATFEKLLAGKL